MAVAVKLIVCDCEGVRLDFGTFKRSALAETLMRVGLLQLTFEIVQLRPSRVGSSLPLLGTVVESTIGASWATWQKFATVPVTWTTLVAGAAWAGVATELTATGSVGLAFCAWAVSAPALTIMQAAANVVALKERAIAKRVGFIVI